MANFLLGGLEVLPAAAGDPFGGEAGPLPMSDGGIRDSELTCFSGARWVVSEEALGGVAELVLMEVPLAVADSGAG